MALEEILNNDLKDALKAKEAVHVSCIRMIKTAIKNKQVEKKSTLKDEEIRMIISSMIKKCQEAAKEFREGGREDLATKEEKEIAFLYTYLPEQLTREEIERILKEIVVENSATGIKDLGKIMKIAMNRMAGRAQGKEVSEIAGKLLN